MSKKKKRNIINLLGKIMCGIGFLALIFFVFYILKLNVLPLKYIIILFIVIILLYFILYFLILHKKIKNVVKIVCSVILFLISVLFVIGYFYADRAMVFLERINEEISQKEEYYLITLKETDYEDISYFEGKKIGFYANNNTKNLESAVKELEKEIKFVEEDFDDVQMLFDSLQNKGVDAILINGSLKSIMNEDYDFLLDLIEEVIIVFVPIETNDIVKVVDVTNTPFNIFLIGSDSYGSIDKVSNSDVNMLVTVNPKTNQILLTSIPRDYYVELYNTNGGMDKLTHAGYYGVETSVKTIENLFDTEINYYVKINFSTVEKVVDLIGGIDVYSDYSFSEHAFFQYSFKKGYNHLNGRKALAFARERKSFKGGDRVRGENQQKVIKAIFDKITSSTALINKYDQILKAVESNMQTNLDDKSILKLIKYQLNKMPSWEFINQSVSGSDKVVSGVYSFKSSNGIYVMEPDYETVENAKLKLNEILSAK